MREPLTTDATNLYDEWVEVQRNMGDGAWFTLPSSGRYSDWSDAYAHMTSVSKKFGGSFRVVRIRLSVIVQTEGVVYK